MRIAMQRGLSVILMMSALMTSAAEVRAEQTLSDEERLARMWLPSISITLGFTSQEWTGRQESFVLPEPPGTATPVVVQPADRKNDWAVTPSIGAQLELMSPELPVPSTPRFFVGAEVIPLFGFERKLGRTGDPGLLLSPLPDPNQPAAFPARNFRGQGAEVTAETRDIAWGAYAGLSFPIEIFERTVRIKPNVAWMRYRIGFTGFVSDGECNGPPIPGQAGSQNCNAPSSLVRVIALNAGQSETFHAVGPGLDLELETLGGDGFGSSVFAGFKAYNVLTDTNVDFQTSQVFNDGVSATPQRVSARFATEIDDWVYRFMIGFRLEWQGKWWPR